ncbi:MAG: phosphoribosyl-ATP diphosphatase [Planctomycetaceae bacterium]|nr:phosphoribosyl-ATP diphosphatase [Planctomycetaceae bacterium]
MTTPAQESVLSRLATVIEQRRRERPAGSYTVELLEGGPSVMSARIIDEAYELIAAGGEAEDDFPSRQAVVHEAADVIYHLMVFLASHQVEWRDVERELDQRFGTGGLVEKARRPPESAS